MESERPGFVLLDVRSSDLFAPGHIPGSVNLPHRPINERNLSSYTDDTLFVVYCAGPTATAPTRRRSVSHALAVG